MTQEEIGRRCADYYAFQNIGLIPRWTDKLVLDSEGNVRDFSGNIIGYYGSIGGKENESTQYI